MKYETFLRRENLTDSTIQNYVWTANYFNTHYQEVNKTNLLSYKEYLMEHYAPSTVNVRIWESISIYSILEKKSSD